MLVSCQGMRMNACVMLRKDVEINYECQQMLSMLHLRPILLLVKRKAFHLVYRQCGITL